MVVEKLKEWEDKKDEREDQQRVDSIKERIEQINKSINDYENEREKLRDEYFILVWDQYPGDNRMSIKEKMFCIDMILRDIRWNWINPWSRAAKAESLCREIWSPKFIILANMINLRGGEDGRYFRDTFPHWYEGMPHWLSRTYNDKSEECKKILDEYLTFPMFDDRKDNM